MAKILHSISKSYTTHLKAEAVRLGRGLWDGATNTEIATPESLPDYLGKDHNLSMRLSIGIIDKIIAKTRTLDGMSAEAYVHRHKLGLSLWALLANEFARAGASEETIAGLKSRFIAKLHPYARYPVSETVTANDKNLQYIQDYNSPEDQADRRDPMRKWQRAFWRTEGQKIDYEAMAKAVFDHLVKQEVTIKEGEARKDRRGRPTDPPPTGASLITARGKAASLSANDPRQKPKKLENGWADEAASKGPSRAQQWYFDHGYDVAKDIFDGVTDLRGRNERISAAWFGEKISKHFGKFKEHGGLPKDEAAREKVWHLHNAIRGYYKSLAKSERFRRALRAAEEACADPEFDDEHPAMIKLKALLPDNQDQLMHRLNAGTENADMSHAIRLGKLFVHSAAAIALGEAKHDDIEKQMSYFATSEGQSEIKRIEVFARIWRQSTAVATRTLTGLTNFVLSDAPEDDKKDILLLGCSKDAALLPLEHMRRQIPVIFGSQNFDLAPAASRSSIFTFKDDTEQQEIIWALIRLAAGVRNAVTHFNVRKRLLDSLEKGVVSPTPGLPEISLRSSAKNNSNSIAPSADQAMERLLAFDKAMRKEAARLELEAVKAELFLTHDQLKMVVKELGGLADFGTLSPPRFTSVINLVRGLNENKDVKIDPALVPLTKIEKIGKGQTDPLDNVCRRGVLQKLYQTGFQTWFSEKADDAGLYTEVVKKVISQKNDRVDQYERMVNKKTFKSASELVEQLDLDQHSTFASLLAALSAAAIRDAGQDTRYKANPIIQKDTASKIERFKQEVFAHLFAKYLEDKGLGFVAAVKDEITPEADALKLAMEEFSDAALATSADWHKQFYTWLYLVPPTEISLLRHQMKKSIALEIKGSGETNEHAVDMLTQMDRLMALYISVQAAGFSGVEHKAQLERSQNVLYEEIEDFGELYSDNSDDSEYSFSGTRAGLRQLVRYGDLETLESVFKSHPITKGEVATFTSINSAEVKRMFDDFGSLRADIQAATKIKKARPRSDEDKLKNALPGMVDRYQHDILKVIHHDFHANAARLKDHVKLHRVLMQVIARLTDYALTWERDKTFAFFGMLYADPDVETLTTKTIPHKKYPERKILRVKVQRTNRTQFVDLLDSDFGFSSHLNEQAGLLSPKNKKHFERAFVAISGQSAPDKRAAQAAEARNETARRLKPRHLSRANIRNDLAHLNTIKGGVDRINLTYLVNAVRSLTAYDQKQKNAVVRSVKRILNEHGLDIRWRMKEDRLTRPLIYPLAEKHLTMISRNTFPDVKVFVPRASVRLTSMVHALFDFGSSGIGIKLPEKNPKRVLLRYPQIYYDLIGTEEYLPPEAGTENAQSGAFRTLRDATKLEFAYTERPKH